MSAPPPPPGPPPPPPPSSRPFEDNDEGSDSGNRNALLNQIQGGLKLKKTVTNDRSAPVLENEPPKPGSAGVPGPPPIPKAKAPSGPPPPPPPKTVQSSAPDGPPPPPVPKSAGSGPPPPPPPTAPKAANKAPPTSSKPPSSGPPPPPAPRGSSDTAPPPPDAPKPPTGNGPPPPPAPPAKVANRPQNSPLSSPSNFGKKTHENEPTSPLKKSILPSDDDDSGPPSGAPPPPPPAPKKPGLNSNGHENISNMTVRGKSSGTNAPSGPPPPAPPQIKKQIAEAGTESDSFSSPPPPSNISNGKSSAVNPPPPPPTNSKPGGTERPASPAPPPPSSKPQVDRPQSPAPPPPSSKPPPAPAPMAPPSQKVQDSQAHSPNPRLPASAPPPTPAKELKKSTVSIQPSVPFDLTRADTSSKHPWKIRVKKGCIMPFSNFDDDMDVQLTVNQIVQSAQDGDSMLPAEHAAVIRDLASAGDPMEIIKAAANSPFYFNRSFLAKDLAHFPGWVQLVAHSRGFSIIRPSGHRDTPKQPVDLLFHCSFDEVLLGDVKGPRMSITLQDTPHEFVFSYPQIAQLAKHAFGEYISQMKLTSSKAVAICNYGPTETGFQFITGTLVFIIDRDPTNGWIQGDVNGRQGWFPEELVEVLIDSPPMDDHGKVILRGASLIKAREMENKMIKKSKHDSGGSSITNVSAGKGGQQRLSPLAMSAFDDGDDTKEQHQYTMTEYAQLYFQADQSSMFSTGTIRAKFGTIGRGTLRGSKNSMNSAEDVKELVNRLKYSENNIRLPLTKITDINDTKIALEVFANIMQYMGDSPTKKTKQQIAFYVCNVAMRKESLRDEVFCQVIKQTTNNRSQKEDSLKRGWTLLLLLCTCVVPSETFFPYLSYHLESSAKQRTADFSPIASDCLEKLRLNRVSPRHLPPSAEEVNVAEKGGKMTLRIFFPDSSSKGFYYESHTTAKELVRNVCNKLDIKNFDQYALFVAFQPSNLAIIPVLYSDKICDTLNLGAMMLETQLQNGNKEFTHTQVVFSRKVWLDEPLQLSDTCVSGIFHQIYNSFVNGDLFTSDELHKGFRDQVARALALILIVMKIDIRDTQRFRANIPPIARNLFSDTEWEEHVRRNLNQMGKLPENEAHRHFIEIMRSWRAFGSTFFHTTGSTDMRCERGCIIAINIHGVMMLDYATRQMIDFFNYDNIMNFRYDDREFIIRGGGGGGKTLVRFETRQGFVIADLIHTYIQSFTDNRWKNGNTDSNQQANEINRFI